MPSTLKIWNKTLIISIFTIAFLHNNVKAQFSYTSVELGYRHSTFSKGGATEGSFFFENTTASNELYTTLNFMQRPIRRLGIGVSIGLPLYSRFKWNFDGSKSTGGDFSDWQETDYYSGGGQFDPSKYEYSIKDRASFTFVGRFFFTDESSFYIDLRYTLGSVRERFDFERSPSTGISAVKINYDQNHRLKGLGFEIGGLAQFNEHFFLNYGFKMDFLTYDNTPFIYPIEYSSNISGRNNKVYIKSQLEEKNISFMIHYGFGYRF